MSQIYNKTEPVLIQESESAELSQFFSKLWEKVINIWPWVILSALLCFSLAYIYLKFTSPAYKIHASLLVQDDQKGSGFGDMSLLQDFGLLAGKSNVDNEAEILKSRSLMEQVSKEVNLPIVYRIQR